MLERDVEAYLVNRVEALGGLTAKLTVAGRRGWPDRLVVYHGLHLVELKRPKGGRLSPSQRSVGLAVDANGASVWRLSTCQQVDQFVSWAGEQ